MEHLDELISKMRSAGMGAAAVASFERAYGFWRQGGQALIPESAIEPVVDIPGVDTLAGEAGEELLSRAVVIKLNGGLGTSMGLAKAKSLLEAKDGKTFLDLIAGQMRALRAVSGATPRLLLMNSFATSADTREALTKYADLLGDPAELEFLQNKIPKVLEESGAPAEWPENSELEWCPPGHGDLYGALADSGWLDRLLSAGVLYAFVANADNLGATMDLRMLDYFANKDCSLLMEVTRRTEADRKGGHLATRKEDGRLILREAAQCQEEDAGDFQDVDRHRFFNTNNLWLRLDRLRDALKAAGGALPLPVICNLKTLDPRDSDSPPVVQLETAMGAAIECFDDAMAIEVDRSRFAPVKSTADLLALRSDAYEIRGDGGVELVAFRRDRPVVIELGGEYKLVDALAEAVAEGVPSLRHCERLVVKGLVRFAPGVVLRGEVVLVNKGGDWVTLSAGIYENGTVEL